MEKKKNNDPFKIAATPRDARRLRDAGLDILSADMTWIVKDGIPQKLIVCAEDAVNLLSEICQKGFTVLRTWSLSKMLTILEYPTLEKIPNHGWQCRVAVNTRNQNGKFSVQHEGEYGPTAVEAVANLLVRTLKEGHVDKKYL